MTILMPLCGAIIDFQRCCASLSRRSKSAARCAVRRVGRIFCASLACSALAMRGRFRDRASSAGCRADGRRPSRG